jgi:hypothetical protein
MLESVFVVSILFWDIVFDDSVDVLFSAHPARDIDYHYS